MTGFSHWRVAGTAGGESNLDPVRGSYNEDGLYGERVGWHLPQYDDSSWTKVKDSALSVDGATVRFFRTTVSLDFPSDQDISVSFVLGTPSSSPVTYRAQLFVNGYQYGRFNPYIGNQVEFPVPVGILDYSGENTIAVAVWAQSEEGGIISVDWKVNYAAGSSLDIREINDASLRPVWTEERLNFA